MMGVLQIFIIIFLVLAVNIAWISLCASNAVDADDEDEEQLKGEADED